MDFRWKKDSYAITKVYYFQNIAVHIQPVYKSKKEVAFLEGHFSSQSELCESFFKLLWLAELMWPSKKATSIFEHANIRQIMQVEHLAGYH